MEIHIPNAREFMNCHVRTAKRDWTLEEVTNYLNKHRISSAPVVEQVAGKHDRLIGFISQGDCLGYLINEVFYGRPSPPQTVHTMMKRHPVCVDPETDVFALSSIFVHHQYRHLPVVTGDRLLGIVSRRDVLIALQRFYNEAIENNEIERFPPDLGQMTNLRFLAKSLD